jgi:pimeloyl-ACP methyl ester carboxylesterase
MGGYETGVRTVWRGLMNVVERRVANVEAVGQPVAEAGREANPVLLVHGYGNGAEAMGALERSFRRDGFHAESLALPEHGFGDAVADARAVNEAVMNLRLRTGARDVDVIGHSRGGLVARHWQQHLKSPNMDSRVITLSSANGGLHLGPADRVVGSTLPDGMQQIRRGSDFIEDLAATRGDADVIAVGTEGVDGVLVPASASRIEGAPFLAVDEGRTVGPMSRVTHYGILRDDTAYETLRGALLLPRS